jgi:hypothetical protein
MINMRAISVRRIDGFPFRKNQRRSKGTDDFNPVPGKGQRDKLKTDEHGNCEHVLPARR